jgi:hypothetical protein
MANIVRVLAVATVCMLPACTSGGQSTDLSGNHNTTVRAASVRVDVITPAEKAVRNATVRVILYSRVDSTFVVDQWQSKTTDQGSALFVRSSMLEGTYPASVEVIPEGISWMPSSVRDSVSFVAAPSGPPPAKAIRVVLGN